MFRSVVDPVQGALGRLWIRIRVFWSVVDPDPMSKMVEYESFRKVGYGYRTNISTISS